MWTRHTHDRGAVEDAQEERLAVHHGADGAVIVLAFDGLKGWQQLHIIYISKEADLSWVTYMHKDQELHGKNI